MADRFSKEQRSLIMANIKGRNTTPELLVKKCLRRIRCRYRSNVKTIPGTPDIRLLGQRKLIFVNGCFWHGHKGCSKASMPKTNKAFWKKKIEDNARRDALLNRKLGKAGWQILTIWQCRTKDEDGLIKRLSDFAGR